MVHRSSTPGQLHALPSATRAADPVATIHVSNCMADALQQHLWDTDPPLPAFHDLLRQVLGSQDAGRREALLETLLEHAESQTPRKKKAEFLEAALQEGVSDRRHADAHLDSHMTLVSRALEKLMIHAGPNQGQPFIDRLSLADTSDAMFAHLEYARRFLKLYPPEARTDAAPASDGSQALLVANPGKATGLSRTLYQSLHDRFSRPGSASEAKASETLLTEIDASARIEIPRLPPGLNLPQSIPRDRVDWDKAWSAAATNATNATNGHPDVQRAILLLRSRSRLLFEVNDRKAVADPVLKQVLKETPYHALQRPATTRLYPNSPVDSLNGVAHFANEDQSRKIRCRHLVAHRIESVCHGG